VGDLILDLDGALAAATGSIPSPRRTD